MNHNNYCAESHCETKSGEKVWYEILRLIHHATSYENNMINNQFSPGEVKMNFYKFNGMSHGSPYLLNYVHIKRYVTYILFD